MEGASPDEVSWFTIYIVICVSAGQVMLLGLILLIAHKLNRAVTRLDQISKSAGQFVRIGMQYFKKK